MRRLFARERHGQRCFETYVPDWNAVVAGNAARNVDRDHALRLQQHRKLRRFALQRSREACAEQGVDVKFGLSRALPKRKNVPAPSV